MIITVETKKQWRIAYTRPGYEKKVAALLEKKKLEVYCPVNTLQRHWMDRKRVMYDPLFTSYVFVNCPDCDTASILQTDGVLNFVYWLKNPAVVCNEEIETIKKFIAEYDYVSIEKTEVLPNDKVRIINGPLVFWEGNVVEVRTNTIKILLPSLGYSLVAEIRKDNTLNNTHANYDIKKVI